MQLICFINNVYYETEMNWTDIRKRKIIVNSSTDEFILFFKNISKLLVY